MCSSDLEHYLGAAVTQADAEVRGLGGDVQAGGDAVPFERPLGRELLPQQPEYRHGPPRPGDPAVPVDAEPAHSAGRLELVPVVIGLVRTLDRNAEVVGLLLAQFGQPDTEGGQVQPGDPLVEHLGQHMHAQRVLLGPGE